MVKCSILGCKSYTSKNKKDNNITYHRFPKDPVLRIHWIKATGRCNWQPTIHSRVCSKHFGDKWFRKEKGATFLITGAYPKLFIQGPIDKDFCILKPSCNCDCHAEENVGKKNLVSISTQTSPFSDIRNKNEGSTPLTENQDIPAKIDYNSPEQRVIRKLIKKTELAEDRHKRIAMMRSKMWRLERKNAYLTSVITDLKSQMSTTKKTSDELEVLTSVQPINKVLLKRVEGVPVGHNYLHQCRVEVRKRVIYCLPSKEVENKSED